jgi:DNA-binding NarL/FixJ family response regulator
MPKPPTRIVAVDDYEPFRRFVASTLAQQPELQIIGHAADGLEAARKAEELQPDLILLDIGLPILNGIEAARRIRVLSPKSKIVFLSENRSLDIIEEALRTGAAGYVLKSDAGRDLLPAVEAVLRGIQFVSASLSGPYVDHHQDEHAGNDTSRKNLAQLSTRNAEITGRHTAVCYSDDRYLLDDASQFIGAVLKAGNVVIAVATESHRASLVCRLQGSGVDIAGCIEQGRYIALDCAETLSTFMVDRMLDSVRFMESFGKLILRAADAAKGEHPRVALFGECADFLWQQGNTEAAIQDEQLCNQLTEQYGVDILCGYSLDSFEEGMESHMMRKLCAEHSAVYSR